MKLGFPQIYLLVDEYDSLINDYLEPHNTTWDGTAVERTFKSFWSTVKSLLGPTKGISRAFITGISPLSLTDNDSGFNVAVNLSFDDEVAGLCGLTHTDIKAALKEVCGSDLEAYHKHLSVMTEFFDGYHFCNQKKVETIYNTETCLRYLQVKANTSLSLSLLLSVANSHEHDYSLSLKERHQKSRTRLIPKCLNTFWRYLLAHRR